MPTFDRSILPTGSWLKWKTTDITESLSGGSLKLQRSLLWYSANRLKSPAVFKYARSVAEEDEDVVAFALFIARTHRTLTVRDSDGSTLLHVLAASGSINLFLFALRCHPACVDTKDKNGDSPYHVAAAKGREEILSQMASPLYTYQMKHMFFTAPDYKLPGRACGEANYEGWLPVHLAAEYVDSESHRKALRILVVICKADINTRRGGDGFTPAHIAVFNGDFKCLQQCFALGARPSVRTNRCRTVCQMVYKRKLDSTFLELCQRYGRTGCNEDISEVHSDSECDEDYYLDVADDGWGDENPPRKDVTMDVEVGSTTPPDSTPVNTPLRTHKRYQLTAGGLRWGRGLELVRDNATAD